MHKEKSYYYIALALALIFHGSILFFTFEKTYDAYVHIFFADHYAQDWFSSWNYKWYTGFTITSYPPLVHQLVALMSKFIGLKMAFYLWSVMAILLLVRGVYKFSLLWVDQFSAGMAAILAVFCSSIVEALHIFGQVPSLTGVAFLLNACPEVYKWFRFNKRIYFFLALALLAVTTTAHHVTTIFGMVFFILPIIGLAVMDKTAEKNGGIEGVTVSNFTREAMKTMPKAIVFGGLVIALTLIVIFPYWYWSKTDPISQVSIPHGSRENFFLEPNLGIVFFLIPWGMMLLFLPFLFRTVFQRRFIFLGLSISLAFLLGTGGSTPIPKMILGETAFNILTLDRFTFWATLMSLPFWGLFFKSIIKSDFKKYLVGKFGSKVHYYFLGLIIFGLVVVNVLIVNMGYFKAFQPEKIDVKPISNFLSSDQHDQWRYLTLGFGDQMAWLSANTDALTVDGNYHSVRRLPEMTTRAVERLENAKYQGLEGLGALQDFLTLPDKYQLKYIFCNDKFYEPLLHFSGWNKVQQLENNIIVWERPDVTPLSSILPNKSIPKMQRLMWGVLPLACFIMAFLIYLFSRTIFFKTEDHILLKQTYQTINHKWPWYLFWMLLIFILLCFAMIKSKIFNHDQSSPETLALAYFDALDFKQFDKAYNFLDPNTKPKMDQFILELSIEDGILASFAKLDQIEQQMLSSSDNEAVVLVDARWITSLSEYTTQHELNMKKRSGKWYVVKPAFEKSTPPDQFFSLANISFRNQGRRSAIAGKTDREDILDRPELHSLNSSLIKQDSLYYVIGEIQNIDNVPAYVSVEAILYDKKGNEIKSYNAMDIITHDLLPKEITTFRVDFGKLESVPADYVIFVKSMVSDKELYKYQGILNHKLDQDSLSAEFINYGTHEINVPQVIYNCYDQNNSLIWTDAIYLQKGIRPQRKKPIAIELPEMNTIERIVSNDNVFINGSPNEKMRIPNMASTNRQWNEKIDWNNYKIRLQANGFVYEINK